MKPVNAILLPLLCAAAWGANVDGLIASARSAPPEFSADALIRIAGAPAAGLDRAKKIELLEDAFERASGAAAPYKLRSALARPAGQAAYWNRVYGQDLDGLTLRLRAVSALLDLDPARARELFARIPPIRLPADKCSDYLVYDVSRFYEPLGRLAAADPAPAALLGRYAGSLSSAVEVAPMAAVLAAAKVDDTGFQTLLESFSKALARIGGDDRSFTSAQSVPQAIEAVAAEATRRKLSPVPLVEAYRVYLVMNLSASRCADDELLDAHGTSFGLAPAGPAELTSGSFVDFFNTKLLAKPVKPIEEYEATPARLEGVVHGLRFCEDEACRMLGEKVRFLLIKADGTPYTAAERAKPEWQSVFRGMISTVAAWKPGEGVPPAEGYEARADGFRQMLALATDPADRELALRGILDFTASDPLQKTSRLEWFLPVNGLLARMALDPGALGKLREEAARSQNDVIALYAALEALAPRPVDQLMQLL